MKGTYPPMPTPILFCCALYHMYGAIKNNASMPTTNDVDEKITLIISLNC